jgi:hypothetical protein
VSYSTRREAEGRRIDSLADVNQTDVESTLKAVQAAKRRANRPIELKHRDGLSSNIPQDTTPVPAIGVQSPTLPPLQLPTTSPDREAPPSDSAAPQDPQPNQE